MIILSVIALASIMAVFGVIGYLHGAKAGALMLALVLVGLLALDKAFGDVAKIVNGLNKGLQFVLSGGIQALGGSGDLTAALEKIGKVQPLMTEDKPGLGVGLVLGVLVVIALLLALLKIFRERPSIGGLLLGLLNGYLLTTNILAAAWPKTAFLPTMFEIGAQGGSSATSALTSGDSVDLSKEIAAIAGNLAGSSILPILIIGLITLIVILASRQGKSKPRG